MIKSILKQISPPFLKLLYSRLFVKPLFSGPYQAWDQASQESIGYDEDSIILKSHFASMEVKKGNAVFERDSILFYSQIYSTPILVGLLRAVALKENGISIVDFGGAFGSKYFHFKDLLKVRNINWLVLEQRKIVEIGNRDFKDDSLSFSENYSGGDLIDVLLFSSSIQYVKNYNEILTGLLRHKPKVIIFDRTPFFSSNENTSVFVQHVPKEIYKASYPTWVFRKNTFLDILSEYKIVYSEINPDQLDRRFTYKGFVFERNA